MKHDTMIAGMRGALVALAVIVSAIADAQAAPPARPLTLWYQQPAAETAKPMWCATKAERWWPTGMRSVSRIALASPLWSPPERTMRRITAGAIAEMIPTVG